MKKRINRSLYTGSLTKRTNRPKLSSERKKIRSEFFFRKHYKKFKYFFYIIIAVSAIYLGHFVIIESKLFRILLVDIENSGDYVNTDDLRVLAENQLIGKNFFFTNNHKIKNVLLDNFLGAKDITIKKFFPNTISIQVREREPVAVIKSELEQQELIIDLDGYVLGLAGNDFDHLPHINYNESVKIGEFLRNDIVPLSFTIIKEIEDNELEITTLNFHDRFVEIITKQGSQVFISSDKDIKNSIRVVSSLEKELNLEGRSIKKIDLRYDKVIVSYD